MPSCYLTLHTQPAATLHPHRIPLEVLVLLPPTPKTHHSCPNDFFRTQFKLWSFKCNCILFTFRNTLYTYMELGGVWGGVVYT